MLGWTSPPTWRRLAAAGLLLFSALAGNAASLEIEPAAQGPLRPGTVVRVAWNGDGLRAGLYEMELILSLDGGLTWPVRLSRDLPIEGRAFEIRIPRLASGNARIGLRAGREGKPETESILAVSGPLAIEGSLAPALEPLARVAGEWRTVEAVTRGAPSPPPLETEIGGGGSVEPLLEQKGADLGDEALLPTLPPPVLGGDLEPTRPRIPSRRLSSRMFLSTPRRE